MRNIARPGDPGPGSGRVVTYHSSPLLFPPPGSSCTAVAPSRWVEALWQLERVSCAAPSLVPRLHHDPMGIRALAMRTRVDREAVVLVDLCLRRRFPRSDGSRRGAHAPDRLQPTLHLLRYRYPVNDYVRGVRQETAPDIPAPSPIQLVVWRKNWRVWRLELSEAQQFRRDRDASAASSRMPGAANVHGPRSRQTAVAPG